MPRLTHRGTPRKYYHPHQFVAARSQPTDPYALLAAAFLTRVLQDAKGKLFPTYLTDPTQRQQIIDAARRYLEDDEALDAWCALAGAEGPPIIHALRREAGRGA